MEFRNEMETAINILLQQSIDSQRRFSRMKKDRTPKVWLDEFCTVVVKTGRQAGHTHAAKQIFKRTGGAWIALNHSILSNISGECMKNGNQFFSVNSQRISFQEHVQFVVIDMYSSVRHNKRFEAIMNEIAQQAYLKDEFILLCLE